MRATLRGDALARQAGRFVWLELDFDGEANQDFLARHRVAWTPAFFIVDPGDERVLAVHLGGMTVPELYRFLDEGERSFRAPGRAASPGDVQASVSSLQAARRPRACAETAVREAPRMPRNRPFASVVHAGLGCANQGGAAAWARRARKALEPLAEEGLQMTNALRDDRFQLYQQLMVAADLRGDTATRDRWGKAWLAEIDSVAPATSDERIALDVARVDAADLLGDPVRVLPALADSERAMPREYTASARLCSMATHAKHYDDALAACDRGLALATGAIGRTGLLYTKAQALIGKRETASAKEVLRLASQSARAIGYRRSREWYRERIAQLLARVGGDGS